MIITSSNKSHTLELTQPAILRHTFRAYPLYFAMNICNKFKAGPLTITMFSAALLFLMRGLYSLTTTPKLQYK